jgi:small-conductance mechanosensitive channel
MQMAIILDFLKGSDDYIPIVRTIITIIVLIMAFNFILHFVKKALLKRVKSKRQISNVEVFSSVFKYIFLLVLIISAIFSYTGSFTGLGLTLGFISAALGWALQKPITGMAAWIMIVIKRPFVIGDRIIIGDVKGDVTDITLTHIYIGEIGGIVAGEESSGRIIMVPNSILFEQKIINYTHSRDEYILDQVVVPITFESNLGKATEIALESSKKLTKEFIEITKKDPYVRTFFQPNGINVHVRYYSPAKRLQEISSLMTKEIFDRIMKTKEVEFAYPHTEILYREKKMK